MKQASRLVLTTSPPAQAGGKPPACWCTGAGSGDPAMADYIPSAPINDEAKKRNGNLPGMGGVFNQVNLHAYHYAGNNPVKYVDPDGRFPSLRTMLDFISLDADNMTREEARNWITNNVVGDNSFPICQQLFGVAMNGNTSDLFFGSDSYIAKQMAADYSAYVNDIIIMRLNFEEGISVGYRREGGEYWME
jgi:hypothetical protein